MKVSREFDPLTVREVKQLKDRYFNNQFSIQAQTFNALSLIGIIISLIFAVLNYLTGLSPWSILICLCAVLFSGFVFWRANKTKSFRRYSILTVGAVFIVLFPALFFITGGYRGGISFFFFFAIVLTSLLFDGKLKSSFILSEVILYAGCILAEYMYPSIVTQLLPPVMGIDRIAGFLLTIISLAAVMHKQTVFCSRKQRELEETNEELIKLGRLKTEYLRIVSHELKTPITVMTNYARDTLNELAKPIQNAPEIEFSQNRIISEGERLNRIVNQILNATAIESGRLKITKTMFSLADLVRSMVDAYTDNLNKSGNRTLLEIPDALPDICADSDVIGQVLLNLLSNASMHTKQGAITVRLSSREGFQTVQVSDTGDGISPDLVERLFLRYIENKSRASGRNGMGLYICKKYIDAHGGEIGIESEQGIGTSVWFSLPTANC